MVEIEYIESTGTQFIRTPIMTNTTNLRVLAKIMITGISSATQQGGDGIWGSAWTTAGYLFIRYGPSPGIFRWHSGGAVSGDIPLQLNTVYDIETTPTFFKVNNTTLNLPAHGGTDANAALSIFSVTSLYPGSNAIMRLYSCAIYSGDTLLANYIPVLDDSNVACLYDSVSETYLYNSGTGDFIAGDPVVPPLGTYTISFNAAGGTGTMADLSATETQPIALTACAFTRDGYTFSGWAITPGGPVVYEDQETVTDIAAVGETITLYAVWAAMPFSIVLQYNKSEPIALTKDVETIATLHGVLREDSSIIDPVILIEGDLALFAQANYMTIQRFHRKYFIVDMVSVRSNFIEITAHCDVLSSFAGAIRSNKGIVHRQEKDWNLMLNDGALQVYQDPLIDTIAFPGSFSGQSYVMLIGGSRGGGIAIGSGDGNTGAKTTSGLVAYAQARLGSGYWYGCYGQTADAALFNTMSTLYYVQYTTVDYSDHANQYGQHVQDCVGLIKGYRWSADAASEPVYNASEDVNVSGLYASCNERHTIASATPIIGSVLFNLALTHCGVYVGNGKVIEARSHAQGVVQTDISDAGRTWTWWGIPSWLSVSTVAG